MTDIIDSLTVLFRQYCNQIMAWYYAAGTLTQYSVIIALGVTAFLVSILMILSRITR